jgi:hypothetical protein
MDSDIIKLLVSGGFGAALLGLVYIVGMRMVAALDRVASRLDEHTKTDLEHHAEVKEAVVRMDAKVEAALNEARRMTPAQGVRLVTGHD